MAYKTIQFEVVGNVGILSLNRPEMVNAVNREMTRELIDFWHKRHDDNKVRVILLKGGGDRGFCSGLDLKDVQEMYEDENNRSVDGVYTFQRNLSLVWRLMRSAPQPIIAAVHGAAIGGGLSFAYTSDIRIASDDAFFRAQFINLGVGGADMGSSYFLWKIVGWGKASEMCFTGEKIDAGEALRIGLINHLCKRDNLIPKALEIAERIALNSRMALQMTKSAFNVSLNGLNYEDMVRFEDRGQSILGLALKDGIKTTFEK